MLALLAAVVLPRAWAYRGLSYTTDSHLGTDMVVHLFRLDLMAKSFSLRQQLQSDPYFARFPLAHHQNFQAQWTTGVYAVARPLAQLFGPQSIWTIQLTNLLFTMILLGAVAGLGTVLGGVRVGLWAALVTALCPAMFASSWYFCLDYPLTAMVAMGLLLLWRTEGFSLTLNSVVFALWSGLALWVKLSYPFYLLLPCCLVAGRRLLRGKARWRVLLNVALAVLLCLGLFTLVEAPDYQALLDDIRFHADAEKVAGQDMAVDIPAWTWGWLLSQPIFAAINFPFPLLALLLPALYLLHRRGRGGKLLVLTFFWGGLLVLTLLMVKMERYLQPLYPAVCLITAWGAARGLPGRWRRPGLAVVVTAYLGVLIYTQYHPTPWFTIPDPQSPRGGKYLDMRMPGAARLDRLRALTHSTRCELQPVLRQLSAWVPNRGSGGLLALVYLQEWTDREREVAQIYHELRLPLLQHYRKRFVVTSPQMVNEPLHPALLHAPALVLAHAPEVRPERLMRQLRVVKKQKLSVRCEHGTGEIVLSLAHPRSTKTGPNPLTPDP